MTILQRLDLYLRDEDKVNSKETTKAPLGSEASSFLSQAESLSLVHRWTGDFIEEFRLSQSFRSTIDTVHDLLIAERDRMSSCGELPGNGVASGIDIQYIKLDHDTDVGIYISFPGKGTEWLSYYLRMQCGGRAASSVDSSRRITVWRLGESRQLRRERYDRKASSSSVTSSELRKDRRNLFDLKAFKDAGVSSTEQ